jgi:hypothetical protein
MRSLLLIAAQILILIAIGGWLRRHGQAEPSVSVEASLEGTSQQPVSKGHPRLWWDETRLRQAKAWYAKNRPKAQRDDVRDMAFRFLMGADPHGCEQSIKWLMDFTISSDELSHVASDQARWHGEDAILVYDWCYEEMTQGQRLTVLQRWNGYLAELMSKGWGGPGMPQSNYFWGYLRNELEWGITTSGDNPLAAQFLNDAMVTRWRNSFLPQSARAGRGGVPQEGSQYGGYLLSYPSVPFVSRSLQGQDLYNESDFFKASVLYLIYSTTPARTTLHGTNSQYYEIFPFNDDERFKNGGSALGPYYADFMTVAANYWAKVPIGRYARGWLNMTGATPSAYIKSVDSESPSTSFASLPLDYYAPGPRYFYGRSAWTPEATTFHLQLGDLKGVGHTHLDYGNWQIWRSGRWLSRESTGYSDTIMGYGGRGTASTTDTIAHNAVLVNGAGIGVGERNGSPIVTRLESRPEYSFAAVDLSPAYRNNVCCSGHPERDNAAIKHLEREYVFIRRLETMVIFDRILATDAGGISADNAVKTFLAHFEQEPTIEDANHVTAANGPQTLRLTTLVPARARYQVVQEGGVGQYRLEVNDSGSAQSYFLHVLQARDKTKANLTASVDENKNSYTVTLGDPMHGPVTLIFNKGATSSGGSITMDRREMPLNAHVQDITVTDEGPVWK